jgi:hypothetical protein
MLIEAGQLVAALGLMPGTTVEWEPLTARPAGPQLAILAPPGGDDERRVVVRPAVDEASENHVAVLETLSRAGFARAPRLVAFVGGCAVEEWVAGVSALSLVPPQGSCEAAMDALAALHALEVHEGLRWEVEPGEVLPDAEVPLHRLGFAAHEREPARASLASARSVLLEAPFGFVHGESTAAHVLLRPMGATLIGFGAAGFGAQFFDVAALLLTAGLEAGERRRLSCRYAASRQLPAEPTADLIDLAGIWWGLQELLALPRRQILALGDEAATHRLSTAAVRIEHGTRRPAGTHPLAASIRAALWRA